MTTMMIRRSWSVACLAMLVITGAATARAQSFMAVLNEATSNADSRRSVTYFDGENPDSPLFSVFIPFEIHGGSQHSYEDPSAISVDPTTGDIFILAFDSGSGTTVGEDQNVTDFGNPGPGVENDDDTTNDWDLYRINFQTVYDHWSTNFQGRDIRNDGMSPMVGNNAPTPSQGATAVKLQDYVTYGVATPYVEERMFDATHGPSADGVFDDADVDLLFNPTPSHSNTFVLGSMTTSGGAIEKIGEIDRSRYSGASNFHIPMLEVIDGETIFLIDDAKQTKVSAGTPQVLANDHWYRIIDRVSTSAGAATSNGTDGGYNNTTTESWQSRQIGQMGLDSDAAGSLISDPQSAAYYSGSIRGMWVVDRDYTAYAAPVPPPYTHADADNADDIAFLQLDANNNVIGYRPFADFGGATKFNMENNPAAPDGFAGRVGQVFVDSDTGDLIIIEEGFEDTATFGGAGVSEPASIRVPVNYDNAGQIDLGAWGTKHVLGANGGITKDDDDTFRERGYWSAYNSELDLVYFMSPGEADSTMPADPLVAFGADIYVMDVNTGLTTSYMNVDLSVGLFFGGNNANTGDKVLAFSLEAPGLDGDFNGDGFVDAVDYTVWRNNLGAGDESSINDNGDGMNGVDANDYTLWKSQYGEGVPPGAGSGGLGSTPVPEPSSMLLVAVGLAAFGCCRRRS
jgi:hypothetical protein